MRLPVRSDRDASAIELEEVALRNAILPFEDGRRTRHHVKVQIVVERLLIDVAIDCRMTRHHGTVRPEHDTAALFGVNDVSNAHAVDRKNEPCAVAIEECKRKIPAHISESSDVERDK